MAAGGADVIRVSIIVGRAGSPDAYRDSRKSLATIFHHALTPRLTPASIYAFRTIETRALQYRVTSFG